MTIEIIGLGAGDMNQLPFGAYQKIVDSKDIVYVRTMDHPIIQELQERGVKFYSFDHLYEQESEFAPIYTSIVETVLEKAKGKDKILYAVPGHPMLAEKTVQLLLNQKQENVLIVGGQSYLDAMFTALKIDPIEGFQFIDGTSLQRSQLNYQQHIIISQVYDRFVASEVKLQLLEDLPADYKIKVVEAAGSAQEMIQSIRLEELDRSIQVSNLTSVYIPPVPDGFLNHTFQRLSDVIATLRGPNGCPWDQAQTHETLREYAIEEVYELIEAIDMENDEGIVEELGDLLLQVMLHSQIGKDNGYFTIDDVIRSITEKMIHRHPHVFSNTSVDSIAEVYKNWDVLKQEEKGKQRPSVLDGIPKHLPSLAKAFKIQKKAAKVGFDWEDVSDVWEKLDEEVNEVKMAIKSKDRVEIEKEFGDVLFVLVNLSRYYKINPEIALNRSNEKFYARFAYIEKKLQEEKKKPEDATLEDMDMYWNEAKGRE